MKAEEEASVAKAVTKGMNGTEDPAPSADVLEEATSGTSSSSEPKAASREAGGPQVGLVDVRDETNTAKNHEDARLKAEEVMRDNARLKAEEDAATTAKAKAEEEREAYITAFKEKTEALRQKNFEDRIAREKRTLWNQTHGVDQRRLS